MDVYAIGLILGGLAIFIYGINLMSDSLKSIAGTKIREYIEKYTRHLFMSIFVGAIISALLHSSSAVTVISISLVRAGLMGLTQAIGITIGANIGTCVTSIMIGLNIEQFSYYFVFVGVLMTFIAKRKRMHYIGRVLIGFGLIFIGLETMSGQLVQMTNQAWFSELMLLLGKQPWFALIGATVATAIMQSSTAVIGVVQKLYVVGALTPASGAAFIFGANVGTCMTALIAAVGGSIPTKRAAWFHAVYNIAGALLGMLLLTPFIALTDYVTELIHGSAEMYIAQAHLIFNVISTILIIPFVNQSVKLLERFIPGEVNKDLKIENIDALDDTLIERFPVAALAVAKKNTLRMGRNVLENVRLSEDYLKTRDNEVYDEVHEVEALVNKYDTLLSQYLLKIANQPTLSDHQIQEYYKNYQIIKYLEQISDRVNDLIEFYKMVYEENGTFSDGAYEDLEDVYLLIEEMIEEAMLIFESGEDVHLLAQLNKKEERLNQLEQLCQQNHFTRMKQNVCDNSIASSVIIDVLSHLERIGDLTLDIANRTFVELKKHESKFLDPQQLEN